MLRLIFIFIFSGSFFGNIYCQTDSLWNENALSSESLMNAAIAHYDGKRYELCLNHLEKAIAVNHNGELSDILYYYRALTHLQLKNDEAALLALDTAIIFNDSKLHYLNLRAELNMRNGRLSAALPDLEKVLISDAKNESALLNKGLILQESGDLISALKLYDETLSVNPNNKEAHYFSAIIYLQNGLAEKGCAALGKAADLGYQQAKKDKERYCR